LLREVLRDGVGLGGDPVAVGERAVHGVTEDSRLVRPGDLFVAVRGAHADGHDHLVGAVAAGAVAAIVERAVPHVAGLQLVVDRSRAALAAAAGWWYGDPSRELAVVGVTGTDGKTTTSFLVAAALDAAGLPAGLVGTVETRVGRTRERTPDHVTTPGAMRLQGLLRAMVAGGDRAAVIETTSHGLAAERVAGIAYDAAILTNLSHEHLEFHGTFEAYRAAKLSLFERLGAGPPKPDGRPRIAIVNADDPAADLFVAAGRSAGARVLTYGLAEAADIRATTIDEDARGLRVGVAASGWSGSVALRLAGRFNVHNALAAIALGIGWDLDPEAVRSGLEAVAGVPGRMERVDRGQPFAVIVDYAHSPAALRTVLDLLGPVASAGGGGLIAVFGSAGERDTEKRPMMGRVAGERCRLVVLTDEDPRGEDSNAILDAIARGAEDAGRRRDDDLLLVPDRARAIATAFGRAGPGDLVLLAGKGHEPTIIGAGGPVAWDERAEAERALRELGYGAGD
ncbi:MAG TPA: UDP-N-acetylmuramoyl-L-alanyl-D-glutamate--2,6-diaminopimelate ligase, partial [Patescibacteria group bacterium]|nr:UDP-N-acetylmuramoyl-L-alanyl-D-glutamate--2,6-diaminopimelate ligase [Patescibacteria group bacterium]